MSEAHRPAAPRRARRIERLLFALATLLSAFLLFLVQPLVAKHILPWFGGAPAVWNVCLAFYQSALFVGYLYAHFLIARVASATRRFWIHAALVAAALALLPVLPADAWKPDGAAAPGPRILAMLVSSVALPFIALSAASPLAQALFARRFPGTSPYPLYALSNLGSLLALLCFPLLVEPWIPVSSASRLWSIGFGVACTALLACAGVVALRGRPGNSRARDEAIATLASSSWEQRSAWLLLPACAVVLLMGVTNLLCLDLSSVPLLWVLPLALYLGSFIICFASERYHHPRAFTAIGALSLVWHLALLSGRGGIVSRLIGASVTYDPALALLALLFATCMLLHGMLQRMKPEAERLTSYYLWISGGGALGGLFAGLLAPAIFDDYHELPLGLLLSWLALGALGWRRGARIGLSARQRAAAATTAMLLALLSGFELVDARERAVDDRLLLQRRTFFGVLRVLEKHADDPRRHSKVLMNGGTYHGRQLQHPEARRVPASYYGPMTAIGMALYDGPLGAAGLDLRGPGSAPERRIGIVGIGAGALAGYGRSADSIVFYEIDPAVTAIAVDSGHFDYLAKSLAKIELVPGDGRLSLEQELSNIGSRRYDILVLDAFSGGGIPIHLLTREAFAIYQQHLRDGGLLAIHVSNRYLDLAMPIARVGDSLGLQALRVRNRRIPGYSTGRSTWVLMTRDAGRMDELERMIRARMQYVGVGEAEVSLLRLDRVDLGGAPPWTDDYSNILSALKFDR